MSCRALPKLHEPPNSSITSPSSPGEDVSHERQQKLILVLYKPANNMQDISY